MVQCCSVHIEEPQTDFYDFDDFTVQKTLETRAAGMTDRELEEFDWEDDSEE